MKAQSPIDAARVEFTAILAVLDQRPITVGAAQMRCLCTADQHTGTESEAVTARDDTEPNESLPILTKQDVTLNDVPQILGQYLARSTIEIQAASLRSLTAHDAHGPTGQRGVTSLPDATGVYNLWRLTCPSTGESGTAEDRRMPVEAVSASSQPIYPAKTPHSTTTS